MMRTEADLREALDLPPDASALRRLEGAIGELAGSGSVVATQARRLRRWLAPVASVAAVAAIVAVGAAAIALGGRADNSIPQTGTSAPQISAPPSGWTQALQDKLEPYVRKVYAVVGHDEGYGDIGLDFQHVAVQVWYHGPLPAKLDPVIAEARAAGVGIEHIQTGWGEKELDAKIWALAKALQRAGIALSTVGPYHDFTEISVTGPRVSTDAALQQQAREIATRTIGNIPIVFLPDPGPIRDFGGPADSQSQPTPRQ